MFNDEENQFYILGFNPYGDLPSRIVVYYCPSCGGSLPPSRPRPYTPVPEEEKARLAGLFAEIKTQEDVYRVLGKPTKGSESYSLNENGERFNEFRHLFYPNVSGSANVYANISTPGAVVLKYDPKNQMKPK